MDQCSYSSRWSRRGKGGAITVRLKAGPLCDKNQDRDGPPQNLLQIEVLRTGYFPDISVWPAAMFEGSNVQWRLRKSAFRIAVQLRRQLYSKLFAYYKRTNTCVKIC